MSALAAWGAAGGPSQSRDFTGQLADVADTASQSLAWMHVQPPRLRGAARSARLQAAQPLQASAMAAAPSGATINAAPVFARYDIGAPEGASDSHSSSVVELPDGSLMAVWFAGSKEGASDVRIYSARFTDGAWSRPQSIISAEQASAGLWRHIRKLGNPVLSLLPDRRLRLHIVAVSMGGWAQSRIFWMDSADNGVHWDEPRMLVANPFFNISTLVRSPAIQRADGTTALFVHHEMFRKFPESLELARDGTVLMKNRLGIDDGLLQPVVVADNPSHLTAFLRSSASSTPYIHRQTSADGGKTWSDPRALTVPNPDSSIAMTRLPDGRLLLAFNPNKIDRTSLALALSADGVNWTRVATVESADNAEYSYPALAMSGSTIDLTYTWNRKSIHHIRTNVAWIDQQRDLSGGHAESPGTQVGYAITVP